MMRSRTRRALYALVLMALIVCAPMAYENLPVLRSDAVQKAYDSWSGVIRLWVWEGWQSGSGSLMPWLNDCISSFERRHPGVYVQTRTVDLPLLRAFASGELPPPDMILTAPGGLSSPEGLSPLPGDAQGVREELIRAGEGYFAAVALGGYGIMYNRGILHAPPANLADVPSPTPARGKRAAPVYPLSAPAAGEGGPCWPGAMLALSADTLKRGAKESAPSLPGVDLGLSIPDPTPEPTPAPKVEEEKAALPTPLPPEMFSEDAAQVWSAFLAKQVTAIPATQREIRRMQLLQESGRGVDTGVWAPGQPFTDQLALVGVVERLDEEGKIRKALSMDVIRHLLTESSQQKLEGARAFSVLPELRLYPGQSAMEALETSLSRPLTVPGAFDQTFRQSAAEYAQRAAEGGLSPYDAYHRWASVFQGPS